MRDNLEPVIKAFPKIVFSTPYFGYDQIDSLSQVISSSRFDLIMYLSFPELYTKKYKSFFKMDTTITEYATRAITSCIPNGIFAGLSIGKIGKKTDISLVESSNYLISNQLNIHYIEALVRYLNSQPFIRSQLLYYPNNTSYKLKNQLRYIECVYKNNRKEYNLSSVNFSEYLPAVLKRAESGATITELCNELLLSNTETDRDSILNFINDLINYQVLNSALEASITGNDPLEELISELERIQNSDLLISSLKNIRKQLSSVDINFVNNHITSHNAILEELKKIGIIADLHHIFHIGLYKPVKQAIISEDVVNDIINGLHFLSKLSAVPKGSIISEFKKAFIRKYHNQSIPLTEALDMELGLGYPITQSNIDRSLVVDNAESDILQRNKDVSIDSWGRLLLNKIFENRNSDIIELTIDDIKDRNSFWSEMPDTLFCICQIYNQKQICIESVGGGATKLLGRYSHLNKDIEQYARDVATQEQILNKQVIYAEVVHIPDDRTANIHFRPVLYNYEIPYLSTPGVNEEFIIEITDLMLGVKNNRLILTSKKLNKEIIPCLSDDQKYHYSPLPVFRFLCDMYNPTGRSGITFSWGGINQLLNHLPRIVYKNCILAKASWTLKRDTLEKWFKLDNDMLYQEISKYQKKHNIPNTVIAIDGDHKIFIDFNKKINIPSLIEFAKKKKNIVIEEFLFDYNKSITKSDDGLFCNEVIFTFYKDNEHLNY